MAKNTPSPNEAKATANIRKAERLTIALMQKRIKSISAQFLGEVDAILGDTKWKASPQDQAKDVAKQLFIQKLAKEMDAALLKLEGVAADTGNAVAVAQSGELVMRWDKEYAKEYLSRVHPKNGPSLAAVYTHSMAANAIATLRSVVVDTFATAAVAGLTARERAKLLQTSWRARCQDDNPCRFVDRAGRRWENARYVQMLVRTTAQRIETASFCDSMTEDGFPLARISNDGDMDCEVCAKWEGRLIDLSHGNQLKKYGAVTLESAREAGVFHPNCTHRLEFVPLSEYPEDMVKEYGKKIGEKRAFGKHNTRKNAAEPTQTDVTAHVAQVEKAAERRVDDVDIQDKLKYTLDHLSETGRRLGGSTGAYLVTVDGKQFVVKGGASEAHLISEMATDRLYKAAGINVPGFIETKDSSGKLYKVADFVEGKELSSWWSKASKDERLEMSRKLAAGMDVDAMVGNWDVIGMSGDNILVDKDGNPWRIDNGGSLSFRAQGGKKDASAWGEGWTDDFFTVPKNSNNAKYVGGVSASQLFRQAGARDWDAILEGLPEAEKKVMQLRVKEAKEQAVRAEDLKAGGYTDDYSDMVLMAANDLCRTGYREDVPGEIKYGDYGNCRPSGSTTSGSSADALPDYGSLALAAAKTINFHADDGNYNKATLNALFGKQAELEAILKDDPGNAGAKHYLGVIDKVKDAFLSKSKMDKIDTSVVVTKKKEKPKEPPRKKISLTERLIDYVGQRDWDDYVYRWTGSQAGDSWNPEAIERKVIEFHAMGRDALDLENAGDGVWNGITASGDAFRNGRYARVRRSMSTDTITRFTAIDAKVKAGTMLLLENADFIGNQRDKRRVMLFRTESERDVFPGNKLKKGSRCDYNTSPAESFSFDHTVYVHSDCAILVPTPYSRINAVHFLSRNKSGHSMFFGDWESEMNVNAIGIPRIFVSRGNRKHTISDILEDKTIVKAIEELDSKTKQ